VSRKTLERWRREGLVARRVMGGNGKPRLVFAVASVERFEKERGGSVEGGIYADRCEGEGADAAAGGGVRADGVQPEPGGAQDRRAIRTRARDGAARF
jgi:hypothetical protein